MNQADALHANDPAARRSFLTRVGAVIAGALLTVFPFAASWGVFSDPLRRGHGGATDGPDSGTANFVRICPLESLPADGLPRAFAVTADFVDAWMRANDQRIGEVFLSRTDVNGEPQVTAFTATCPHLGCAVEFDIDEDRFECPCHESGFAKDGKQLFGPSRRGLDELKVRLDGDEGTQGIWVEFQRFRAGVPERIPVG